MIVREHINFQRGIEPKDAMHIGLGPKKYLDIFEKTLNTIPNIKYDKQIHSEQGLIYWKIYNVETKENILELYLLEPSSDDDLVGWVCKDIDDKNVNHKDPFFILNYLKKQKL